MAPRLLWIGLGNMGRAMCKNLVEKGPLDKPILLYNRTQKRTDDLTAKLGADKAEGVSSVIDGVGRADIVFSCLSNDAAIEQTYDTILKSGQVKKGKLFIDCSTIAPETSNKIAEKVMAAGAEFVASPVVGSPPMADASQLLFITAGPKGSVDKLRPYIKGVMGRAEIALEDKPCGAALKFKLIGNSFTLNMACQLAEGLTLGEKAGFGAEPVQQFVDIMYGGVYSGYARRMVEGTYWKMEEPLGSANTGIKDAILIQKLAAASGAQVNNVNTAKAYLEEVKEYAGGDKGDIAGMYGAARKRSGLKFENDA